MSGVQRLPLHTCSTRGACILQGEMAHTKAVAEAKRRGSLEASDKAKTEVEWEHRDSSHDAIVDVGGQWHL